MYDDIFVPTDGSAGSERAGNHATYLCERYDATLHGLYAVSLPSAARRLDDDLAETALAQLTGVGNEALERLEAQASAADVPVVTQLVEGEPADAIAEHAADAGADLIVMGTHGKTGLDRYLLGSVTEETLERASVPVLTVRGDSDPTEPAQAEAADGEPATSDSRGRVSYDDVLVGVDGGEGASNAVDHALGIAARCDADVYAVSIVDTRESHRSEEIAEQLDREGEEAVERVVERARDLGLDVTAAVREGVPFEVLRDCAADEDVDLLAVGTRGRDTTVEDVGTTTARLVRTAPAPVLVAPDGTSPESGDRP